MHRTCRILLVALLSATGTPLVAQTRVLTGRVLDSITTHPVTFGQVLVLGTPISANIHEDGSFAVSVPMREVTLQFVSENFRKKEMTVPPNMDNPTITLSRDYFEQDALVISGQATGVERRNLANAVGSVRGDELSKAPASSMDQALKGKVAGADVHTASPAPGSPMLLRLRGVTSILGSSQPLYVVDGVILYGGIDALNPNDIEDIQILKGASASAMYGSKASNGVVIVKTKRGGASNMPRR